MNTQDNAANKPHAERVRSTESWVHHFRRNRGRDWAIPWDNTETITADERHAISSSIAEFQRGESSAARHYLGQSERFGGRTGDPVFHAASVLFIREENEHAALLLRFMRQVGIPARGTTFADRVFRRLRAFSDLGWASRVLVIAELIAQEYYPCLRVATRHPALVRICDKVIYDEEAHIDFQVERIVRVEAALGRCALAWRDALQAVLMCGAALVVYFGHGRVLGTRFGCAAFVRRSLARNRTAQAAMKRLRNGCSLGIAAQGVKAMEAV